MCTAAQRAVCSGVSTLGGERAEGEGVSGPDGSEEGRWRVVIRTQEMRKPRKNRKGPKSRKCRKDGTQERGKTELWASTGDRRETEKKEGREQERAR